MTWSIEYWDGANWVSLGGIFDKITEELNGHKEAIFTIPNNSTNRSIVANDKKVRISWNSTVLFVGILSAVSYSQDWLECKAYDECISNMQSKIITGSYDDVAANTILSDICMEAGVVAGSCPTTTRSVRFDKTICFDAATFLADVLNKDWWTDYDASNNPRFNIGTRGSDKGSIAVISISRRGIDRSKKRDKVIIRGVDKDGNAIYGEAGTGSSVAVFTEKKAKTTNDLNDLALKKLTELNKESSGVSIEVPINVGYNLYPGDMITINEDALNLSGSYRIWKIIKKLGSCEVEIDRAEAILEKYLEETKQYEELGIYSVSNVQLDNPAGAPAPPSNLVATSKEGAIALSWDANTEADLDRYIIYRDTVSPATTEYTRVDTNSAVDRYVEYGQTYYYRVRAVDRVGNLSDYSNEVAATPLATLDMPSGPPSAPTGLAITSTIKGIILEWNKNTEADFDHYIVYRDTFVNPTTEYATTKSTVFLDPDVQYGTTYYYRLKAVDRSGNASVFSSEVSASPVKVDSTDIAPDAIEASHILSDAIRDYHIKNGEVPPSKLLVNTIFLDGIDFTDNDPSAGYVSWTSGTLYYEGVAYNITSGNTNYKYIYWEKPNTTFSTSNTKPSWSPNRFIIAVNDSGTHTLCWNSTFIHGGMIITGTITAQEIKSRSISGDRLETGTITSDEVLNIDASKIVISGGVYLANWRHSNDVTKIDGGKIYTGSITADQITADWITGKKFRTSITYPRIEFDSNQIAGFDGTGTKQFYLQSSDGKAYCGGGSVILDQSGITLTGEVLWFYDTLSTYCGAIRGISGGVQLFSNGPLGLQSNDYIRIEPGGGGGNLYIWGNLLSEIEGGPYELGSITHFWNWLYVNDIMMGDNKTIFVSSTSYPMIMFKTSSGITGYEVPCLELFDPAWEGLIIPKTVGYGFIGVPDRYFHASYTDYVFYKNLNSFESLDDIKILKQMKSKTIKKKKGIKKIEVEEEIIDPETIHPRMKDESETFLDLGATLGFVIGVCKRLVERIENLEEEVSKLRRQK